MRCYAVDASTVTNGTDKDILSVISAATVRPRIYDMIVSSIATPNDYSAEFNVIRFGTDGTGTAVTPSPLDPGDPASLSSSKKAYSAGVTAGVILLDFAVNLRATFRWVAYPGRELVLPATAANGASLRSKSASTAYTSNATIMFEE